MNWQDSIYVFFAPQKIWKISVAQYPGCIFFWQEKLFHGLKIDEFEKDWEEYPVFGLDFAVGDYTRDKELNTILDYNLRQWELSYGLSSELDSLGLRFMIVLEAAEK